MKQVVVVMALTVGSLLPAYSQQTSNSKVGYANMDYIISKLPDMKQIESEMKSTQTQLRNQIQARSQEVQKQYTDFNAQAKTMADTVRAGRQRELEKAMADLEKMQQDAQLTLENKHKLYMAPIYLKVNRAIQEVAKENGYGIILTDKISTYNFLLYHTTTLDISDLVLQKFGITAPAK